MREIRTSGVMGAGQPAETPAPATLPSSVLSAVHLPDRTIVDDGSVACDLIDIEGLNGRLRSVGAQEPDVVLLDSTWSAARLLKTARRVRSLAKSGRTSASRVLVDLVEAGLAAKEAEKRRFLDLADRLARSDDPAEQARLKKELARLTFGG